MTRPARRRAAAAVVLAAVAMGVLTAAFNRFRSTMNREACASNLHAIGLGVLLYQQDHDGLYPDTLGEIVDGQTLSPQGLVCPASSDTAAAGPMTRAVALAVDAGPAGGHCSYVYVGRGRNGRVAAGTIVAYEPIANHGDGGNVLFGDGHADWLSADVIRRLSSPREAHP